MKYATNDTIAALATAPGIGALSVLRVSGPDAISVVQSVFSNSNLKEADSHTLHYGYIRHEGKDVDEVMVSLFRTPRSFTTEDTIEITCHGSTFIQKKILEVLCEEGCRLAQPGEFTLRAFLNGRIDLTQAEAVADVIASATQRAGDHALKQLKGGISDEIRSMREKLIHFASLVELELDFGEEDVEFADRKDLAELVNQLRNYIQPLLESFTLGNAIKEGVPVAIVGRPNAGKSTLLNQLLKEERAIVSEIAGTTRDTIEANLVIDGINFRLVDTAGIRSTEDKIEAIGVDRAFSEIEKSSICLYIYDISTITKEELKNDLEKLSNHQCLLTIGNKSDLVSSETLQDNQEANIVCSAEKGIGLDQIKDALLSHIDNGSVSSEQTVVTNARHVEALSKTDQALGEVLTGLQNNVTGDMLSIDIRRALQFLGEVTGEITTDDLLDNIFSKFCIGK